MLRMLKWNYPELLQKEDELCIVADFKTINLCFHIKSTDFICICNMFRQYLFIYHYICVYIFLSVAQKPKLGLGYHIIAVPVSHPHTHPVGFLWSSDDLVTEVANYTTSTRDENAWHSEVIEPATPILNRLHNLDVRHPRCVGSITKNFCVLHVQSNTTVFYLLEQ